MSYEFVIMGGWGVSGKNVRKGEKGWGAGNPPRKCDIIFERPLSVLACLKTCLCSDEFCPCFKRKNPGLSMYRLMIEMHEYIVNPAF